MQHSPLIHLLFLKHLNERIAMYWIGSKYFFTVTWRTQYRYIDNPHILIQIYIGYTDTRTHLHIKIYYFITIMYPCIRCICRKNNRKSWIYLCIRIVSVLCPSSCCNMHWWLLKAWKIIQYPLKFPVDELSDIFKQCLFTQRPPVVAFFFISNNWDPGILWYGDFLLFSGVCAMVYGWIMRPFSVTFGCFITPIFENMTSWICQLTSICS